MVDIPLPGCIHQLEIESSKEAGEAGKAGSELGESEAIRTDPGIH
jgi:hypothetical protein